MTDSSVKVSPRSLARIAAALYFVAVMTAVSGESFLRGSVAFAAGVVAISCYIAATLLLYVIFKPVNKNLSLLAASFHLVGFTLEALRWNPRGVDFGVVFHGLYCLLIGYLVFRSTFLPRILGVLIAFAGLSWLTFLSPSLANNLSPYNAATGFLGEGPLMLWLLVVGVNAQRWKEQASAAKERQ